MKRSLALLCVIVALITGSVRVAAQDNLCHNQEYNRILSEALNLQIRSDSLSRIVRDKRIMAKETPDETVKKQLVSDIIKMDKESKKLQREADKKFSEARDFSEKINAETLQVIPVKEVTLTPSLSVQTIPDEFVILDKSPYSLENPIPRGLENKSGLIYRVQLGVFSKQRPSDSFGGISPISYEQAPTSNVLKYYAGMFYSLSGVTNAVNLVKNMGFPDAFVVAYLNGKQISTEEAKEIEFAGMKL